MTNHGEPSKRSTNLGFSAHTHADVDWLLEEALAARPLWGSTSSEAALCRLRVRDMVMAAIAKDPQALRFADEQARADREIVLAAVTQAGAMLKFAQPSQPIPFGQY